MLFQLDGYIARNFKNQATNIGSAIDPLADKILVTTLTVTLSISNLLPGKQESIQELEIGSLMFKKG